MSYQSWKQIIAIAQSDGAAHTAATSVSLLPSNAIGTIPAGYLDVGSVIRIRATGRVSTVITTPGTTRFDVRFGSTVVWDGLAILNDTVAAHVNVPWVFELELTCRSVGTAATLFGVGLWTCEDILGVPATAPKGVLSAVLPWNTAPVVGTSFDSTVANAVDFFHTQTVATGSITLHTYTLSLEN